MGWAVVERPEAVQVFLVAAVVGAAEAALVEEEVLQAWLVPRVRRKEQGSHARGIGGRAA